MFAWRSPSCSLPDDDKRLSRMVGMSPKKWSVMKPSIMCFWKLSEGHWTQKRLTKEREFVEKNTSQKRAAGEASARAKALKNNDSTATAVDEPLQRQANNPYPYPETINTPSLRSGVARERKRALRMPDNFEPDIEYAVSQGLTHSQARYEAEAMRDWSKSSPNGAKLDWPATWRGWVRRKIKDMRDNPRKTETTLTALDRMIENDRPNFFDALTKTIDYETERNVGSSPVVRLPAHAQRY